MVEEIEEDTSVRLINNTENRVSVVDGEALDDEFYGEGRLSPTAPKMDMVRHY
jgi:hypothetical protein